MKRWANLLVGLLLAAGVSILLYPTASNWLASRNHSRAIVEYSLTVEELAARDIAEHLRRARAYNASLSGAITDDAFASADSAVLDEEYFSILDINGMLGYVSIPSIGVHLPIHHTVGEEVLHRGVGHLPESAFPIGDTGDHAVLSAHRGLPSARLFTDLHKLEPGDYFYLHILDQTLCYRVDQVRVVEPWDTGDLQPVADADYATLVTCTPYAINSHRLLVRGARAALVPEEEAAAAELLEQRLGRDPWIIGAAALAVSAAVWAGLRALRKRRGDRPG